MRATLLTCLFICGLSTLQAQQDRKLGVHVLPNSALTDFAPALYAGEDGNDISTWVSTRGGEFKTGEWAPPGERYVQYKAMLIAYWFGPYSTATDQHAALQALMQVRNTLIDRGVKEARFVSVRAVLAVPGKPIGEKMLELTGQGGPLLLTTERAGMEASDVQGLKIEELKKYDPAKLPGLGSGSVGQQLQALGENGAAMAEQSMTAGEKGAMGRMRAKYGGAGASGGSDAEGGQAEKGNGLKGPFPASYAFSKWFATMVDMIAEALDVAFCQGKCKSKLEEALRMAYMIMPDVMDRIASSLAKLQDKAVSDKIEDKLDRVADNVQTVLALYKDLKALYALLAEGDFEQLLGNKSLADALKALEGVGIEVPGADKFCEWVPCDELTFNNFKNLTYETFAEKVIQWGKDKAVELGLDAAQDAFKDVPGLNRFDFDAARALYNDGDWSAFGRAQATSMGCSYMGNYSSDCAKLVQGDARGAARSAIASALSERAGLGKEQVAQLLSDLEGGNYTNALRQASKIGMGKYGEYFGPYAVNIQRMLDDPGNYKSEIKSAMNTFIRTGVQDENLKRMLSAQAFLYEQVYTGRINDWKGTVTGLMGSFGVDEQRVRNVLDGSFTYEMEQGLVQLAPYLGITEQAAREMMKIGKLKQALDRSFNARLAGSSSATPSIAMNRYVADRRSWQQSIYDAFMRYYQSPAYHQQLVDVILPQ